jgi:3-hydroxyisobutyrate dehydrogenase-like beta-hydroxyacid dehydrogenase
MSAITSAKSKLGFVGIGYMGRPIAQRLLKSGFRLTAYDRHRTKAQELIRYGGTEKAGLDRNRLLDVLSETAVVAPAHVGKLEKAMQSDYSPQFPLRLMNKDFGLILSLAAAARRCPRHARLSRSTLHNRPKDRSKIFPR